MPTLPPPDVKPPKDDAEMIARAGARKFIESLCGGLERYAYGTRSHMPARMDYTDFVDGIRRIEEFCAERPDWALKVLMKTFEVYRKGGGILPFG
jgi:hypothetical protein